MPVAGRASWDVASATRARAVMTRLRGRAVPGPAIPDSGAAIPPIANRARPSSAEAVPAVCGGYRAENASDAELGRIQSDHGDDQEEPGQQPPQPEPGGLVPEGTDRTVISTPR
jgi:hypothetical protein